MGNRQQSRFLALMENYDRLVEVQAAAMNSEDAGLIQYSKTLDSLETKLNNIKTNFQQFYMEIINGPLVGGIIDLINKLLKGFNAIGSWNGLASLVSIIGGIKSGLKLLTTVFSNSTTEIISDWNRMQDNWLTWAKQRGYERGKAESQAYQSGLNNETVNFSSGFNNQTSQSSFDLSKYSKASTILTIAGGTASTVGAIVGNTNQKAGATISYVGSIASGAGMGMKIGAMTGNPIIAAIATVVGGLIPVITGLGDVIEAWSPVSVAKEALAKAEEEEEAAKLERAEARNNASNLESTIANLKKLQAARYQSEEAEQEYIDACNTAAETYPQLVTSIDESGNQLIDIVQKATEADNMLAAARLEAAEATEKAATAELKTAYAEYNLAEVEKQEAESSLGASALNVTDVRSFQKLNENSNLEVSNILQSLKDVHQAGRVDYDKLDKVASQMAGSQDWQNFISEIKEEKVDNASLWGRLISGDIGSAEILIKANEQALAYVKSKNEAETKEKLAKIYETSKMRSSASSFIDTVALDENNKWATEITSAEKFLGDAFIADLTNWAETTSNEIFIAEGENAGEYTAAAKQQIQNLENNYQKWLKALYEDLGYNTDDFNELLTTAQKGGISANEFQNQWDKLGLATTLSESASDADEAAVKYWDQYSEVFERAKETLLKDLISRESLGNLLAISGITYLHDLNDLLDTIPYTLYTNISEFVEDIQEQVDNGYISQDVGQSISKGYFSILQSLSEQAENLTNDQLYSAQQAIITAGANGSLLSLTGQADLEAQLAEIGLTEATINSLNISGNLESATYNLITEFGSLSNTLATSIDDAAEVLEKAASGLNVEELSSYMKKYNLDFADFEFIDGKYYLTNIERLSESLNSELDGQIQNLNDEANKVFNSEVWGLNSDVLSQLSEIESVEELQEQQPSVSEDQWKYAKTYYSGYSEWATANGYTTNDLSSQEAWKEYIAFLSENLINAQTELIEYATEQADYNAKKAAKLKELRADAGITSYEDLQKRQAQETIAEKGLTGYTEEEISELSAAIDNLEYERQADGTYTLKNVSLGDEYGEVYQAILNATIKRAKVNASETLSDIATKIANGDVTALEGYDALGHTNEEIELALKSGNKNSLKKIIQDIYQQATGITLTGVRLEEEVQKFESSYQDATNSNIVKYFELVEKRISGTITNAESADLETLKTQLGENYEKLLDDLTGDIISNVLLLGEYAVKAVQDGKVSYESVKTPINNALKAAAYQKRYESDFQLSSDKSYEFLDSILEDKGQYDNLEDIEALLSEEGVSISPEDLVSYFKFDEKLGKWIIDDLKAFQGFLNEEYQNKAGAVNKVISVLEKGVTANNISEAIDVDSLKETISNSISSILSDTANASLQDLISLYEEINGEDSFNDEKELERYQEALAQAQEGEVDALIAILKELAQGKVDDAKINAIIADAKQTALTGIFTSLTSGLSGSLTNTDFYSLAKQLDIKSEDYSQYVYSTTEGLKYTTEGALSTIDKYLETYGYTADAARAVAELLASSDSALGTYEGITAAIEKIEAKGEKIEENEQKTLNNLKAIKAQLSQIAEIRMFDFMSFDYFDGQVDNFTTLTNNIESAISTLESAFEDGGKIKATDFLNMFHWMEDYGDASKLSEALGIAVDDLQTFKNAMISTMDLSGNLDFSKLTDFPITLEGMAKGLDSAFQDIAKEQAEFWDDYADFLENLGKLEEALGDEELQLIPELNADGIDVEGTQEQINKVYSTLKDAVGDEGAKEILLSYGVEFDEEGNIKVIKDNIDAINAFITQYNTHDASQLSYLGLEALSNAFGGISKAAKENVENIKDTTAAQEEYTKELSDSEDEARNLKQTLEEVEKVAKRVSNIRINVTSNIQTILDALTKIPTSKTVKVNVVEETSSTTSNKTSNLPTTLTKVASMATGNANNISGSALINGTNLTNKTLVGELGPELAVYDNQYHLLGENGAEFVNLPDDAIVFNHKQTRGIIQGQAGYRGTALVEGNAYATGSFSSAAAQAREIAQMWQALANQSVSDLLDSGSGGGGGSGNTIKAVTEELEEWYNLTRQISDIEQEINNIVAERKNILEKDGAAYLRSLRAQERLLNDQVATQQLLLGYQELQLQRQKDQINTNAIWSQFLTVGEDGLLQYKKGNELNGGKGALQVLQELNEMSGADQVAFLEKLGYSYTDNDGNKLEGEELVQQFFDELQDQIDQYDSLYDTVHSTEQTLEDLESSINEINDEIKQNQLDLEQAVYDIVVEAWEAQIDAMEEQKDLIEEANKAYVEGLNNALSKEKELYSQNQSISDRESLQRQLSLLRRSGGSASQIASLEEQLDSALKDEYFNKQQQMIENIEDANEEQVRKLEEQIRLQEEALEYQKENGVIWTKVYEILGQGTESILDFMAGNSSDFFSKSALQQEEMLIDWAHKVGIYTEDKIFENHRSYASKNIWGNGQIWDYQGMSALQGTYNSLSADQQQTIADQFANEYASARMSGDDNETAAEKARQKVYSTLSGYKEQIEAKNNNSAPTTGTSTGTASGGNSSTASGTTYYKYIHPETGKERTYFKSKAAAEAEIDSWANKKIAQILADDPTDANGELDVWVAARKAKASITSYKKYSSGGLVDYTGIAAVHGSPSKPESFLNAEQTQQIREALEATGKGGALSGIKAALNALNTTVKNAVGNYENSVTNFTVAPGAVVIQVEELADSYDVEELSKDVMNRMVSIASKSTSRGVNRR